MTFSSYRAFGNPSSSPYTSQYLANRSGSGWNTEAISPPQEGQSFLDGVFFESSYKAFDEELCNGWVFQSFEPPLAAGAVAGYSNLYRRSNCAPDSGTYESITRIAPEIEPSLGESLPLPVIEYLPSFQGFSEGGGHTVFRAAGRLVPEAAPCTEKESKENGGECPRQVYDFHNGKLSLVCILPIDKALRRSCSVGTGYETEASNLHNGVFHAVSADGSRIVWSDAQGGPGKLYQRIDGKETVEVSKLPAVFLGAATDGSRVIFNVPEPGFAVYGNLREFDAVSKTGKAIAGEVTGVLGVSDDAKRVYFNSHEALPSNPNERGQSPLAGANNLYLYVAGDPGGLTFVATLSEADAVESVSPLHRDPLSHTSRVTPDGLHALFTSTAPLTGFDNTDAVSGEPDTEVFLYSAASGSLLCVSCSPSGARPHGYQVELIRKPIPLWAAGSIPGWTDQTHPSRALSDDGKRVFFDSSDRLVLADTNRQRDVYEWEPGEDQGACQELGAEVFLKQEGGCISLISSGQSSSDSEFLDAGSNGRDVFFRTASSLLTQDPGLFDIYDAREEGGFPAPPQPSPPCEGEGCQTLSPPPPNAQPPSATFEGAGNLPLHRHRHCAKSKVRRHGKCVRKHKHHHQRSKHQAKGGRR